MRAMGLKPREKVLYERAYEFVGSLDEQAVRRAEAMVRCVYAWVKPLPKARARAGRSLLRLMSLMPAR